MLHPLPAPKRTGPGQGCLVKMEEEEPLVPELLWFLAHPHQGFPDSSYSHTNLKGFRAISPSLHSVTASS